MSYRPWKPSAPVVIPALPGFVAVTFIAPEEDGPTPETDPADLMARQEAVIAWSVRVFVEGQPADPEDGAEVTYVEVIAITLDGKADEDAMILDPSGRFTWPNDGVIESEAQARARWKAAKLWSKEVKAKIAAGKGSERCARPDVTAHRPRR